MIDWSLLLFIASLTMSIFSGLLLRDFFYVACIVLNKYHDQSLPRRVGYVHVDAASRCGKGVATEDTARDKLTALQARPVVSTLKQLTNRELAIITNELMLDASDEFASVTHIYVSGSYAATLIETMHRCAWAHEKEWIIL